MASPASPRKPAGRPSVAPSRAVAPPKAPAAKAAPPAAAPVVPPPPPLDAAPFQPDAATVRKLGAKGGKALAAAQEKSRTQALQALHSLRLLGPGLTAVLGAVDGKAPPADQAAAFVGWVGRIQAQARTWAGQWEVPEADRPWVEAALERILAESPSLLDSPLLDKAADWAQALAPPPPTPALPLATAAPLALLQGLAPVLRVQAAFPLGRATPDADLEAVSRLLVEAGTDAIQDLVDPAAAADVRLAVFTAVVADAGKTLAQAWVAFADAHEAQWRRKTAAEQQAWSQAHPEGVALEPLFEQFQDFCARLRRLTRAARVRA